MGKNTGGGGSSRAGTRAGGTISRSGVGEQVAAQRVARGLTPTERSGLAGEMRDMRRNFSAHVTESARELVSEGKQALGAGNKAFISDVYDRMATKRGFGKKSLDRFKADVWSNVQKGKIQASRLDLVESLDGGKHFGPGKVAMNRSEIRFGSNGQVTRSRESFYSGPTYHLIYAGK